ncbi:MAG: polyprenyl synthetase family protein [Oscillospiraceae bacterium]|nr:polyprenyl synthetase family protein [Oscillospiraceae bacterium]
MPKGYESRKNAVDSSLEEYFANKYEELPHAKLIESMRYSVMAGGKRIRPILVSEFCRVSGGGEKRALPAALAIEMLHTYSLIHDDLPCMDGDDYRRGKPTNHKVYGEWLALLAGDALQAEAYYCILSSALPADLRADCAEMLAEAAGADGICAGQYLDMSNTGKEITDIQLLDINSRKTASLIVTACRMGAVIGGAGEKEEEAAVRYGAALGMAFQIRDDMLDEIGRREELGKDPGSDGKAGKTTFMTVLGGKGCEEMIRKLTETAKDAVLIFKDNKFLTDLADSLAERTN